MATKQLSRSVPLETRLWSQVKKTSTCWLWTGSTRGKKQPRGVIRVNGKKVSVPRLVYSIAKGPIPNDKDVLHSCDVPLCCNPSHLFLGDDLDNQRDALSKGRFPIGERNGKSVLNDDLVRKIRKLRATGLGQIRIGSLLGLRHQTVGGVLSGRTWGHVV